MLLLRFFRANQANQDHQVLKASRGSQVSQVSMALLAPKVLQVTEESWEEKYVTQDMTFIALKGTLVFLFFVQKELFFGLGMLCQSLWYVCSRVSGVKGGRMAHLDLQDLEEQQDLQ